MLENRGPTRGIDGYGPAGGPGRLLRGTCRCDVRRVVGGHVRAGRGGACGRAARRACRGWPRPGAGHRYRTHRLAPFPPRRPGPRHRPVTGDGRQAPRQAGRRRDWRDDRRLRVDNGGRQLCCRLPGVQHDHESDLTGSAGGLLPQRCRTPGARRVLRRRGRDPGPAEAPARAERGAVPCQPDAVGVRRLRRHHTGDELQLRGGR